MTEYGLLLEDISENIQFPMDVFSEVAQPKTRKITIYHSSDSFDPKTIEEDINPVLFGFRGLLQTDIVERERKLQYLLKTDNDIILVYFDRDIATYVSISKGAPTNDPAGSGFDIFSVNCTAKGAILGQVREAVDTRCTTTGYDITDTDAMLDEAIQLFGKTNYLIFTEVDPNTHLTVAEHHLDFDAYKNEDCYLYKDYGADYFGDFTHKVDAQVANVDDSDGGYVWLLANNIDDVKGLYDGGKSYIGIQFEGVDANKNLVMSEYTGAAGYHDSYAISESTIYYLTITKLGTSLTCKAYSDSGRTTLLDTLTLTLHSDYTFRYLYGCNTYNSGGANVCTLDIENLTIDDAAVYFTQTQNEYMLPNGDYNMVVRMKQSADASANIATMEVDVSSNPSVTQSLVTSYKIYELAFTVDASDNENAVQFKVSREDVSGNMTIDFLGFAAVG